MRVPMGRRLAIATLYDTILKLKYNNSSKSMAAKHSVIFCYVQRQSSCLLITEVGCQKSDTGQYYQNKNIL